MREKQFKRLINKYLDNCLTIRESRRLACFLRENPERLAQFRAYLRLDQSLRKVHFSCPEQQFAGRRGQRLLRGVSLTGVAAASLFVAVLLSFELGNDGRENDAGFSSNAIASADAHAPSSLSFRAASSAPAAAANRSSLSRPVAFQNYRTLSRPAAEPMSRMSSAHLLLPTPNHPVYQLSERSRRFALPQRNPHAGYWRVIQASRPAANGENSNSY